MSAFFARFLCFLRFSFHRELQSLDPQVWNEHTKATMASLPIFLQQQDRSEETVSVPIVPISQSPESIFEKKQAASSDQFPQEVAYITLIT